MNKYVPIAGVALLVVQAVIGGGDVGNLVANGDFAAGMKGWRGGNFGGGEGTVELVKDADGNAFARLFKKGPGGVQFFSPMADLGSVKRYRLSFRYRFGGLTFVNYHHRDSAGRLQPVRGATGAEFRYTLDRLSEGEKVKQGEWVTFSREYDIPEAISDLRPLVQLQFQSWQGPYEIDDLKVEPLGDKLPPPPEPKPKVTVTVKERPLETGFSPVERIFPLKWENRNGLFYRNGRPYFFCGTGQYGGGGMEGAAGLWLSRLQGLRFIGTYDETPFSRLKQTGTNTYECFSVLVPGWVSWQREAARFGFLTEPHPLIAYSKHNELGKLCREHPELDDVYSDLGHYLSVDAVQPLGRAMLAEARRQYFGVTFPNCGTDYCEIAREPGVENFNSRMIRDFRNYVKRKYDGDLALVNRVWKTDFKSFDAIHPLHLDRDTILLSPSALALRKYVLETKPEHYYDCLRFIQLDTERRVRNEFEDVRRAVPGIQVTTDIRGHHSCADGYAAYDPDLIGPLEDICNVHCGFLATDYNNTPFHQPTYCDVAAYPLFSYAYFVRNVTKPIIQCEDIVSKTVLPGSDREAMANNDFAQLHKHPWKFHIEEKGEDGLEAKWFAERFDDSAWGEMMVPGCWDETEAHKGRGGIAWYRTSFVPEARLRNDFLDGSRKFVLVGKGVAQEGTVYLNGEKLGEVVGWDTPYRFDVGAHLRFGMTNEITWRVNGNGYSNGLRFFCHVLCEDMLNFAKPFAEKQYAQMYWTYMMRGTSGVLNWNWHNDRLQPYLPFLIAPLETAAAVVLEDVRMYRSKVAILYSTLSERGLPYRSEKRHYIPCAWQAAVEFCGTRPDIVSKKTLVHDVTPERYSLLIVPEAALVMDETYRHFCKYVQGGGTAIISPDSLRKTFSRYAATDIDSLDAGRGRIVRMKADQKIEDLMAALAPYLPEAVVRVEQVERNGEQLYVERLLAGGEKAKVLYLSNWGGFDQKLRVTIPEMYRGWKSLDLRGAFTRGMDGAFEVFVPQQDVAALLLTKGEPEPWMVNRPRPETIAVMERLAELCGPENGELPKVLWAGNMEYYPYFLDRFDSFGLKNVKRGEPHEWSEETLKDVKVIVLAEDETRPIDRFCKSKEKRALIKRWVEDGGSLCIMSFSAGTINAYAALTRSAMHDYGLAGPWRTIANDPANYALGDTRQILTKDIAADSPLTAGVKAVQLFTCGPMKKLSGSKAVAIVSIPKTATAHAGDIAMGAVEIGKGRVFMSADTMFAQPMRIELGDNAALLENIVGWLVRQEVTDTMREDFRKKGLFVTKKALE